MLTVDFARLGLRPGMRLLDLGAGAGRHTYEGLRRGADVVAADLDGGLLKDVRDMCAGMVLEGEVDADAWATCAVADATRLPFDDASFDRVIVSEVLEHIPDDHAALREVERILKPGGRAALTVPRFWPERICWALSDEYHSNEGGHVRIYRRAQLAGRAAAAGLRAVGAHHAHAFHSPYWWIKCAVGPRRDDAWAARTYHRFLVWQISSKHELADRVERALDPLLGKSLVLYLDKREDVHAA